MPVEGPAKSHLLQKAKTEVANRGLKMAFSGDLQSFCIISAVGHGMKMDRKPQNFISSEKHKKNSGPLLRISIFTTLSASKERYASSLTHEQRLEHGHVPPPPPQPTKT